ncbi:MAG: DUF4878 domain-containing protein [Clostridia bacterium]|nr:DUF4878 domain-containing protein [Clostridia bacterium]
MKRLKKLAVFLLSLILGLGAVSCDFNKAVANPTPESLVASFYTAWEKSDVNAIANLTHEKMWEVEAKSADVSVNELKTQFKATYAEGAGSTVYYKVLSVTEYKAGQDAFEDTYKWALDRYEIEIEGYAVVRVAVTYDNGEPVTEDMGIIKIDKSWYAKDLLGI